MKCDIQSIAEKRRRVERVIDAIASGNQFLILGHKRPDDDCLGSMVAIGLLIQQFSKLVYVSMAETVGEKLNYLLDICRYNSIGLNYGIPWRQIDTIVVCDTAKRELLEASEEAAKLLDDPGVRVIEIDHHLGLDAEYIGDPGYQLVMEASSSAEIIAYFTQKLSNKKEILREFGIEDLYPRNFVLSIITGLVGDTNLGQFLPTPRVARSYHFFSRYYNRILRRKTVRLHNYSSQEELFQELGSLSGHERRCFERFLEKAEFRKGVGFRGVSKEEMIQVFSEFGSDTVANTSKAAADSLAEAAGKIGIVAYWNPEDGSPYVRCSARRANTYHAFDLRELITIGKIQNGGGHPGAVGFRVPKDETPDVEDFVEALAARVSQVLP